MGMDVYGIAPTAEVGKYFRNNIWWWHPLWTYVQELMPDLHGSGGGHSNDGYALDATLAAELAEMLTTELESGRTAEYAKQRAVALEQMPDERCSLCHGTGTRTDATARELGLSEERACNGCGGTGWTRPFEMHYHFSVENVLDFRSFVAASGGFEIW